MGVTRRFGPVQGAGVAVVEREPEEGIQASALGVAALFGQFERGDVSTVASPKLNRVSGLAGFTRMLGGRIAASVAPDVAQDYWAHGEGAGELVCVRLTDGSELTAELTLFNRKWGTDWHAPASAKGNEAQLKRAVLKVTARNAGAWGGKRRTLCGEFGGGELTETTLATGQTLKVNELAGATLALGGVAFRTYEVLSNTAAGVATVKAGATMVTDLGLSADKEWRITLDNGIAVAGGRKALGVKVVGAEVEPTLNFGLEVYLDGVLTDRYPTLSMDPASQYYVEKVLAADDDALIAVNDLWKLTGEPVEPDTRPANFHGRLTAVDATTATVECVQAIQVDSANVRLVAVRYPAAPALVPHRLTFTWVLADTKYTVAAAALARPGVILTDLPDFTVGAGEQLGKDYDPGYPFTVGLRLDHAASPVNGTKIILDALPLDAAAIAGGELVPNAANPYRKLRVRSATHRVLTVESGDPSVLGTGSTAGAVTGTIAEPYAIVVGVNDAMRIAVDGRKTVAVILAPDAAKTAAAVALDINAAFDAIFPAGTLHPATAVAGRVVLTSPGGFSAGGPASTVELVDAHQNAYATLGMAVGLVRGTAGSEADVGWLDEPANGFDGGTPADQKYLDALSLADTPLRQLADQGKGVIQFACPGTTATAVQKQMIALAEGMNYYAHLLLPAATTTEQAAVDLINTTIGRSDFAATYFPSYGYVNDPDRDGVLKLIPLVGMVLGRDALYARRYGGYHRPAAGIDATLPRVVKLPTGDTVLNEEILNPQGLNVVKKLRGNFVLWGARGLAKTSAFRFRAHRLQLSHYEWVFRGAFDWVIFLLNTAALWAQLVSAFKGYFASEFAKGAVYGVDLDDAVTVKIDAENNPPASMAAGDLNAEIGLRLPDVVERFVVTVGKRGVYEGVSA